MIYLGTMDYHTAVIDEGIVEEKLGVNIFLTLLGGGGVTYVTQKWKGGSFNFFRTFKISYAPSPGDK